MKAVEKKFLRRWPSILWLAAVWVLLWGDVTWANAIMGIVVGVLVMLALPIPAVGWEGTVWLPGLVVLITRFVWDVISSALLVAKEAVRWGHHPHPAVIRAKLRSNSDVFLTITSQLCCLVPGSLTVEANRFTGTIYMHFFDMPSMGGVEACRNVMLDQEKRVLYAFATDAALLEAGLPSRWGRRRRKLYNEAIEAREAAVKPALTGSATAESGTTSDVKGQHD